MATIGDTLVQIQKLQNEFDAELATEKPLDRKFVEDLMNLTSVYYTDLLAHASMGRLSKTEAGVTDPFLRKYTQIISQPDWHSQYLRWQNIGLIYSTWSVFEQLLNRLYDQIFTKKRLDENIQDKHKKLLDSKRFKRKRTNEILAVFNGIRRTRNSLHNGGVYQQGSNVYTFEVGETKYVLEPGKPVQPVRAMDVILTIWRHYLELKQ